MTRKSTMKTIISSVPLDLMIEILIRLPAKSVWRFRSVSKSWCSIIRSQQFIDAFMSLSLSRPRLVFACNNGEDDRLLFFSSPHRSCFSLSSSPIVVTEKNTLTMRDLTDYIHYICNSIRGFVCCSLWDRFVVCNPTTGQVIHLEQKIYESCCMWLGYDPKNDQFKALHLMCNYAKLPIRHSVRTLGGPRSTQSWRPIKTSFRYNLCNQNGVCIDGVVYYKYEENHHKRVLSSFDVGSEIIRLIETPEDIDLSGYLTEFIGKLVVYCSTDNGCILWVLDDVKNQVWSKKSCIFPSFTCSMLLDLRLSFVGITASREIIYASQVLSDSFELFCYDVEKKMERRVRVEGLPGYIYDGTKSVSYYSSLLCSYVDNIIFL